MISITSLNLNESSGSGLKSPNQLVPTTTSSIPKGRSIRCQFCPQKYYSHYSVYISHLNHSHRQEMAIRSDIRIESRTFNDYDEFSRFKLQLEYNTGTHYNKSNSRSDSYILFKCHRFGEPRYISEQSRKRRKIPKYCNWTKSCPAFLRMIKFNGKYETEYCTFHLGHEDQVLNNDDMDYNEEEKTKIDKTPVIKTKDCDDQKENQSQMVAISIPIEHRPLIETIVQLIKNEDKLKLIRDTINSMTRMNTNTTRKCIRTSLDDNDQQNQLRTSPRKRKQAG